VIDHWVYDQIVGDPVAEAALKAGEIDALFSTYGFPPDYHDAEVSSRIGNFSPSKYAGSFWNLYQWYLK
jgi:hypothetical protein